MRKMASWFHFKSMLWYGTRSKLREKSSIRDFYGNDMISYSFKKNNSDYN